LSLSKIFTSISIFIAFKDQECPISLYLYLINSSEMAVHNELGKMGEALAKEYLLQKGFRIIECNWHHRKYEIDIIASNDEFIIFAEIKARSSEQWGTPEEAVSDSKIRRIVEAADFYLNENEIDKPVRFDVISIILNDKQTEILHIEDAFMAPLN